MIYELIQMSNDYHADFTPTVETRLEELLIDYQRGQDVDKDEIIRLLVGSMIGDTEEVREQISGMGLFF